MLNKIADRAAKVVGKLHGYSNLVFINSDITHHILGWLKRPFSRL